MAVAVTGAAGFIGRVLVRTLLAAGHRVVAIDRERQPECDRLTVLTADLLDADEQVRSALATADAVFHLAGCPGVRESGPRVELRRQRDNVEATRRLLRLVPLDTALLVASSSSVYGGSAGRPCAEGDPLRPRGGYARSKVQVEVLCAGRLRRGGAVTVARPFTVAGEGQRPDMALARWIEAARIGSPLALFGDPERTRDVTDVAEVARAFLALTERCALGVVNVGTGVGHTLGELAAAVGAALGAEVRTVVTPAAAVEASHTLADTRRLRRLAGFVPRTDLPALVARQVAAARPAALEAAS